MRTITRPLLTLSIAAASIVGVFAQNPSSTKQPSQDEKLAQAEKAFHQGNALMEQRKHGEALVHYKQAQAILPDDPAVLFNTGVAAFATRDYALAADMWTKLKAVDPLDWHARAKLVQVYQALGKVSERDKERAELFEMWKSGKPANLKEQFHFCREQFEVKDMKIMAFEHYELKGDRALRYVFSILNKAEDDEEFRISLGSYRLTDAIWRESRTPKPKPHERLFHLDGYFKNGSHATYGMYFPEPSYDEVRTKVIQILEGKDHPVSATVPGQPKPTPKPTPQ